MGWGDKLLQAYLIVSNELRTPRRGQGLVEYALILVLVAVAAIVALQTLGGNITNVFGTVNNAMVPKGN